MIQYGAEVITYAFQKGSVNPQNIRDAGIATGQHVAPDQVPLYKRPGYEETTVDVVKIIGLCDTSFSDQELQHHVLDNLPEMVDTIRATGTITILRD